MFVWDLTKSKIIRRFREVEERRVLVDRDVFLHFRKSVLFASVICLTFGANSAAC